jgi:hypothetical protein
MIKWMGQRGYSWGPWAFSADSKPFDLITNRRTMSPTAAFGVPVKAALAAQAVHHSSEHGAAAHH